MTGVTLWQQAASFAARAHAGQLRKDERTPYFAHPVRVAMTVREVFGCDDAVCIAAAFLHDVIEDTGVDYDELLERFGAEAADCVAALSKDMRLPEEEREAAYDRGLAAADWRARLVKLADTYDNLCDIHKDPERVVEKARRAIRLAQADADTHKPTARGIEAVEALIKSRSARR